MRKMDKNDDVDKAHHRKVSVGMEGMLSKMHYERVESVDKAEDKRGAQRDMKAATGALMKSMRDERLETIGGVSRGKELWAIVRQKFAQAKARRMLDTMMANVEEGPRGMIAEAVEERYCRGLHHTFSPPTPIPIFHTIFPCTSPDASLTLSLSHL